MTTTAATEPTTLPEPGALVRYHGSATSQHGEFIYAGPCFCYERVCLDAGPRYVLWDVRRTYGLKHVGPDSFTAVEPDPEPLPTPEPQRPLF